MKHAIRKIVFLLAFSSLLLMMGCSGSGGGYTSVHYGVYDGYGYPYGYGYGGCCYDDIDVDIDRPDREDRIERREQVRTHAASRAGSSVSMGRPARMSRGGGGHRR